jgi:hypothetical protein
MNARKGLVPATIICLLTSPGWAAPIPTQSGTPIVCGQATFEYTYCTAIDGVDPTPELAGDVGFIQEANGTSFFTDTTLDGDTARVTYTLIATNGLQFDDLIVYSRADIYNGEGLITGHYRVDAGSWQLFFTTDRSYDVHLEESYTNQNIGGQTVDVQYTINRDETSYWTHEVHVQLFRSSMNTSFLFSITGTMEPDGSDDDADGLADGWEMLYFGGDTSPTNNPDADPHNNLQEYIAGTNPTNAASYFTVSNIRQDADGPVIQWGPCVPDRWYGINWSGNLMTGFTSIVEQIGYPQSGYTDTVYGADASGFYRVDVQIIP